MGSLVIGCGGTGKWTVTYLKENIELEEAKDIACLVFDADVDQGRHGANSENEEKPIQTQRGFSVDFISGGQATEFVPLSCDLSGTFANAGKSDPSFEWLNSIEANRHHFTAGTAGGVTGLGMERERGRMVAYASIREIKEKLREKMTSISADAYNPIFIVSSLAGGCGSSILLDLAIAAQEIALTTFGHGNYGIFGVFVLPRFFENKVDPENRDRAKANGFAALRELARCAEAKGLSFEYPNGIRSSVPDNVIPFDSMYLVDGWRENAEAGLDSLSGTEALWPALADFIFTLLTNVTFTSAHCNVITQALSKKLGLFSSMGIHTHVFPRQDVLRSLLLGASEDIVGRILDARPTVDYNEIAQKFCLSSVGLARSCVSQDYQGARIRNFISREGLSTNLATDDDVRLKSVPNLRDKTVVRVGLLRPHRDVQRDAQDLEESYVGNELDRVDREELTKTKSFPFKPAVYWFREENSRQFKEDLYRTVQELMNEHKEGGPHVAAHFVESVRRKIQKFGDRYGEQFDKLFRNKDSVQKTELKKRKAAMSDHDFPFYKTDNKREQQAYLSAYFKWLEAYTWRLLKEAMDDVQGELISICRGLEHQLNNIIISRLEAIEGELKNSAITLTQQRANQDAIKVRTYVTSGKFEAQLYDEAMTDEAKDKIFLSGQNSGFYGWVLDDGALEWRGFGQEDKQREKADFEFRSGGTNLQVNGPNLDANTFIDMAKHSDLNFEKIVSNVNIYDRLASYQGQKHKQKTGEGVNKWHLRLADDLLSNAEQEAASLLNHTEGALDGVTFHGPQSTGKVIFDSIDQRRGDDFVPTTIGGDNKFFTLQLKNFINLDNLTDLSVLESAYDKFVDSFYNSDTGTHVHVFRPEKLATEYESAVNNHAEHDYQFRSTWGKNSEKLGAAAVSTLRDKDALRNAILATLGERLICQVDDSSNPHVFFENGSAKYKLAHIENNNYAGAFLKSLIALQNDRHHRDALSGWYAHLSKAGKEELKDSIEQAWRDQRLVPDQLREGASENQIKTLEPVFLGIAKNWLPMIT